MKSLQEIRSIFFATITEILQFIVYPLSGIVALAYFLFWTEQSQQIQLFALTALIPLYFALLISHIKSFVRVNTIELAKLQQSLVVSTLFFALTHACLAFFTQLGGFSGIPYLSLDYRVAIASSLFALFLLSFTIIASIKRFIHFIPAKLKSVQNAFLYIAGVLILFHALQLGTHFKSFSLTIPVIIFLGIALLCLLKTVRFDNWILKKRRIPRFFGISSLATVLLFVYIYVNYIQPSQTYSGTDLNLHAQDAQDNDRQNEKFGVSFIPPDNIKPNQPVKLEFNVANSNTGEPVKLYGDLQYKVPRLVVVSEDLSYYRNLALDQYLGLLFVETSFPNEGRYRIYVDYQPFGSKEQQSAFVVEVGIPNNTNSVLKNNIPDPKYEDETDGYIIKFRNPRVLDAGKVFAGQEILGFDLVDAKTGKSVTRVEHYLGRWGTLSIINVQTFDFIYSQMTSHLTGAYDQKKHTMILDYTPSGMYGPVRSGAYKVWLDIQVGQKILSADFILHMR